MPAPNIIIITYICCAPHLGISPKRFTVAIRQLYSFASEKIHCSLGVCDCDCAYTVRCCCFIIHRSGVLLLLHGWYHVKLLLSRRTVHEYHTNMHQFPVSLCLKHIRKVHHTPTSLSSTLPPNSAVVGYATEGAIILI